MDVFISHAGEQRQEVAVPLKAALEARGVQCWLDEDELQIGDSLSRAIGQAIRDGRYIVCVVSKEYLNKEWPSRELSQAVAGGRDASGELLPVLYGGVRISDAEEAGAWLADLVHVVWEKEGPEGVADHIARKVKGSPAGIHPEGAEETYQRPRLFGPATAKDIREFSRATLKEGLRRIEARVRELEEQYRDISGEVLSRDKEAFEVRIFLGSEERTSGFYLSTMMGPGCIAYVEGEIGSRNSMNGWLSLTQRSEGGHDLSWNSDGFHHGEGLERGNIAEAAEWMWKRAVRNTPLASDARR